MLYFCLEIVYHNVWKQLDFSPLDHTTNVHLMIHPRLVSPKLHLPNEAHCSHQSHFPIESIKKQWFRLTKESVKIGHQFNGFHIHSISKIISHIQYLPKKDQNQVVQMVEGGNQGASSLLTFSVVPH